MCYAQKRNLPEILGYYRVQYDDDLLNRIETLLKSNNFGDVHELNRAHLVDDIYNLAKIDVYKYERVFQLFDFLKSETSYYTWNSALTAFSNMLSRTGDERIREALSVLLPISDDFFDKSYFCRNTFWTFCKQCIKAYHLTNGKTMSKFTLSTEFRQ